MKQSVFSFIIKEQVLCVIDHCNEHPGSKSVTNDAENVFKDIQEKLGKQGIPMPSLIVYKDTDGNWDGMEGDENKMSFYPIQENSLTKAITIAKFRKENG